MQEKIPFHCKVDIPENLHTMDRKPDNSFKDAEELYRRFNVIEPKKVWVGNNTLSGNVFPVKNDSYNRQQYSVQPEDVLYNTDFSKRPYHFFDWGILTLKVSHFRGITSLMANNQHYKIEARPVHKPELCMYPHTEIHLYVDDKYIDKKVAPPSLRTSFRDILVENCVIYKYPENNNE